LIWLKIGTERIRLREGETTVGRSPYCSIVVSTATASRQHAAFVLNGLELTITDLGSRNGTSLNGTKIRATTPVFVGDIVTIGSVELLVVASQTAPDSLGTTEERLVSPVPATPKGSPLAATLEEPKPSPERPREGVKRLASLA
jgi:pSer/pThr/pTyr-binding forkhead associated (FHA) protein